MPDVNEDADSQDLAETFDETNITRDGDDIAHPDMARDVYDVTSAAGDADEDEGDDDDFEPDDADEAELEELLAADEGVDEPRGYKPDNGDRVASDDATPADFEADDVSDEDLQALGYADPVSDEKAHVERQLDHGLKETFPASDPVSINPGAD
ncbi:MAG TPA: primosomal protein [Caulobacteraceae bacterium]